MIKLPDFIIIPYQLLADKKITLIDERLYGIIYWFTKLKNESCTASNLTLAELIKSTPGTIQNSLTKLEQLGYIQRIFKDEQKKIRKEIIALVVFSKVSPTDDTVSPTDDTRYHPPVNRIRIYNKNNKEYKSKSATQSVATPSQESDNFFKNEETQKKAIDYLTTKGFNPNYALTEIKKFISYWTEPTKSGKKQRWETEKTYDVRRRLATWLNNSNKFNRSSLQTKRGIEI